MNKQAVTILPAFLLLWSASWGAAQERKEPATAAPAAVEEPRPTPNTSNSEEYLPPEGYKKRSRNGKVVYCRQVVPGGTLIKRNECFTRMELDAIEQAQRAFREDLRNQGLICADSRCSGG
jgi:hypothetical protein